MAKTNTNTGLEDISGRISKWVYRTVNGKTVIAARPKASDQPPSEGQMAVRNSFRTAVAYARSVMADALRRPIYEAVAKEKKIPVFALAIGDYFKPPIVHLIDLDNYHGKIGDKIRFSASDDVQVMSARVEIRLPNGTLVEQGVAVEVNKEWFYTATTALAVGAAVKIHVFAKDRPGHEGELEKAYP